MNSIVPAITLAIALAWLPAAGCNRRDTKQIGNAPAIASTDPGELIATGAMKSARAAHTVTLLPDGRVLIAGGMTGDENSAAGAELYDPATGTFGAAGAMLTPRHSHAATRLPDGSVLITGGYDAAGHYLRSAERYDPATNTFSPAGTTLDARAGHAAVPLADGRVLLAGGVGEGWTFLASAELYDPATQRFVATGAMQTPRESHVALRLADGRVLVVGGHQGRGAAITLYRSAEIYDPASGKFSTTGSMSTPRHKHDAVLLDDGRVLVTGGTDKRDSEGVYAITEVYDPATGTFHAGSAMHMPRYKHLGTSLLLADGRVLLAGGAERAEVYDPRTDSYSLVESQARLAGMFSASVLLTDGRVLITGGYGRALRPERAAWIVRLTPRRDSTSSS